jgi:hypothetical protein
VDAQEAEQAAKGVSVERIRRSEWRSLFGAMGKSSKTKEAACSFGWWLIAGADLF